MNKSRLRINVLKNRTNEKKDFYTKWRNYCISFLKKSKKNYTKLNEKDKVNNKRFWKSVKPSMSNKVTEKDKINLSENCKILKTKIETAEDLNDFFL